MRRRLLAVPVILAGILRVSAKCGLVWLAMVE